MRLHTVFALVLSPFLAASAQAQSTFVEEGRLLEPVPHVLSTLGTSAAISGGRIAVGDADPGSTGQVFTYAAQAGLWQFDASATASDGASGDRFGAACALDGDTLVVGAYTADVAGFTDAGAAYVFERVGANWVQQQKFVAGVPRGQGQFGTAVAISGSTLAIGAPQTDINSRGEVDVYVRVGSIWMFQQKLVPNGLTPGARAGTALALRGDLMAIGAPFHTVNSLNSAGRAFVFQRGGGSWSEVAAISSPAMVASGTFGRALALSEDRLVIGAPGEPLTGAFHGRAHVFASGAGWAHEATLEGAGTATQNSRFGASLSLSGNRLAIGTPGRNTPLGGLAGSVKVFERSGPAWTERLDLYSAQSSFNDQLGESVALSGDLVVGGAPNADVSVAATRGEAYVWRLDPPDLSTYCTAKVSFIGCVPAVGWSGTPSASSNSPFLVTAAQVVNQKSGMLIYGGLYAQTPFHGGTLCVAAPIRRTAIQNSGGTGVGGDCTGSFAFDFNAHIQSGVDPALVPGKWVFAQYWYRDPLSTGGTGLSNAIRLRIGF